MNKELERMEDNINVIFWLVVAGLGAYLVAEFLIWLSPIFWGWLIG